MVGKGQDGMELEFNIIYTPGTVRCLQLFVFSLLKWSDCSFRLIANGCSVGEKRLLESLCQKSNRLTFMPLPSDTAMRHDRALSYLQAVERSDYFCFMDSDILATGDFLSELVPYLGQYAGVFSGSPVWCRNEERVLLEDLSFVTGRFTRTAEGLCLGNTYFALYDNRTLSQFVQSTGISFELFCWGDIPTQWQSRLVEMGLGKRKYDTGKVLNLLLLAQGERLMYAESEYLQHIGGISTYVGYKNRSLHQRASMKLSLLKRRAKVRFRRLVTKDAASADISATMWRVRKKETKAVHYFAQVLRALCEEQPLPATPRLGDPEIEKRIELVAADLASTYEEFRGQLVEPSADL